MSRRLFSIFFLLLACGVLLACTPSGYLRGQLIGRWEQVPIEDAGSLTTFEADGTFRSGQSMATYEVKDGRHVVITRPAAGKRPAYSFELEVWLKDGDLFFRYPRITGPAAAEWSGKIERYRRLP